MDATEIATILVSTAALCASGVMIYRALWRHRLSLEGKAGPVQFHRFTRRRLTMGVALAVVAVMLLLGVCVFDWTHAPRAFAWYWLVVLGLLLWLILMALFDMFSVLHTRLNFRNRRDSGKGD